MSQQSVTDSSPKDARHTARASGTARPALASRAVSSLDAVKSDVCDTTLAVMAWLIVPAVGISVSRALDVGWTPQYTAQCLGAGAVWLIAIFRKRIPYVVRANLIIFLLLAMGWAGQIATLAPTSYVFFVAAGAMAAVFYGAAAGIVVVALSVLITFSSYFAIKAGYYPVPTYPAGMTITTWISRAASLIVAAAGPVIAITQYRQSLMRELKRAEDVSEAKSAFLATMSHELRTPMTAIIGTAELLQQDRLPADHAGKIDRIARAGKNLLSLLNDLLDFAKIEARQMPVDKVAFSVNDLLGDVRDLFAPLAEEKGLTLRAENLPVDDLGAHDALIGDPVRLRQILSNLVGNAVKFTQSGEIVIAVSQTRLGPGEVALRLAVADSGMGIAPDDQARLFQPFVQAENFRTRTHGGTGLGLAISRKLAELMGGELTVVSEIGKGSTFTLTVPLPIAQEVAAARAETKLTAHAGREPLRVLLAEDNDAIRDLMREMITRRGHKIHCVENGLLAVHAAEEGGYDVIIMDMHMPVMDGAEATRDIRDLGTRAAQIPIVALTAGLTEDQRRGYLEAGVNQVVAKPAHWPTLFEAIESRGHAYRDDADRDDVAQAVPAPETSGGPGTDPRPSGEAVLDTAHYAELESVLGADVMRNALGAYRTGLGDYLVQLQATLDAGDVAAAHRLGHAIKGSSRQFGAMELGALGAAIEAKTAGLDDMKRAAAELPAAAARFDAALEKRNPGAAGD